VRSPGSAVKLRISHPELAPELVRALNETDCLAARIAIDTVEVFAPWLLEGGEPAHAGAELLFFVKAWAARHPQFRATLLDEKGGIAGLGDAVAVALTSFDLSETVEIRGSI